MAGILVLPTALPRRLPFLWGSHLHEAECHCHFQWAGPLTRQWVPRDLPDRTTHLLWCLQPHPGVNPHRSAQGLIRALGPGGKASPFLFGVPSYEKGPRAEKAVCAPSVRRFQKLFLFLFTAFLTGKHGDGPGSDFYFILFSIYYLLFDFALYL